MENETPVAEKVIIAKEKNNQTQIAGAIVIAGIIIAGAILLKGSSSPVPPGEGKTTSTELPIRAISKDEHIFGNPNAEVFVVEYSDTECPFCKRFHATMHDVVSQNNGKVAWVYRHFPIPELHQRAFHEAEATECAWEQGGEEAFWKYVDEIYVRTNSNDSLDPLELPKIAESVGLNVGAFNACLESGKFATKVQADMADGERGGVRGTPMSFIVKDGKLVDTINGAQPIEVVTEQIQKALR